MEPPTVRGIGRGFRLDIGVHARVGSAERNDLHQGRALFQRVYPVGRGGKERKVDEVGVSIGIDDARNDFDHGIFPIERRHEQTAHAGGRPDRPIVVEFVWRPGL